MSGSVTYVDEGGEERTACADMVAGCDGVNSVVRRGIAAAAPAFRSDTTPLPGNLKVVRLDLLTTYFLLLPTYLPLSYYLKVVRLDAMPSALNADAVRLVPGSPATNLNPSPSPSQVSVVPGSPVSAFIEPTRSGACALLTWRYPKPDPGPRH